MNETGATVVLRGMGSGNLEPSIIEESQQPLHLYLSSTNPQSLEAARSLVENLLQTIYMECSASRTSSGKAYSAVPPPLKMLTGFQSSGETLAVNANPVASLPCTSRTSVPISPSIIPNGSIIVVPPGSILHSGTISSSGNLQPHMVSYPYPTVNRGTCYSGYGGIYPQATPLQQVALALKNASPSSTLGLASTTSTVSVSPKPISCTLVETEKRIPQKRKFQELPVSSMESTMYHQTLLQKSECLKPGSEDFGVKNVASMPPPNMLANLKSNQMPRPPPPTMPSAPPPPNFKSPPPPPKFVAPKSPPQIKNNGETEINKLNNEPISDTLLKLVEYGEDDEETDPLGKESQGKF